MSRYFYEVENLKPNQIYNKLVDIMERKYYNFSIAKWQQLLEDISKSAKKKPLINIEYIPITENELLTIDEIKSKPMKRVAFSMLCLAKYRNMVNSKNNNWINYEFKDIFRMANVTATIKEQCYIIHDMKKLGLIKMNKLVNSLSINVCYIDVDNESKEVLRISDFRNLGYEYLLYCGEKFFRCERCGILSRQNKDNTRIYCTECAKNYYQPMGTKTIKCIDCGKEVEVDSSSRKMRCDECNTIHRRSQKLNTWNKNKDKYKDY